MRERTRQEIWDLHVDEDNRRHKTLSHAKLQQQERQQQRQPPPRVHSPAARAAAAEAAPTLRSSHNRSCACNVHERATA
ncbi:unnamed protein product [Sphagnum jensenii]|uniref:Uncharacterized protein n=1 Tax=Sphagnum jensenii TaxID=128206 RepID=A0ABP1C0K4_9BRYO